MEPMPRSPLRQRLRPVHWLVLDVAAAAGYGVFASGVLTDDIEQRLLAAASVTVECVALIAGRRWPLAAAGGIVFCWLPYHFLRLEHLHLANYAAVPIAVWLVLRVAGERPPFFERGRLGPATTFVWVGIALVAATSIYYAFFAVVLVAAVGVLEALAARSPRPAASAVLVIAAIGAALAIALAPALRYRAVAGSNSSR